MFSVDHTFMKMFWYFCVLAGCVWRPACSLLHLFWQPATNECLIFFFSFFYVVPRLTGNWTALWGEIKYFLFNWMFHGFLYWIWLYGWWTQQPKKKKALNNLCNVWGLQSEKKLLPHVGGAVRLMQDRWVEEPFVPAVIGFLNHSVWDQQPTTNFIWSIDILPNKMTICTQHWRSLSW